MSIITGNVLRRNGNTTYAMAIAVFTKTNTPHEYIGNGLYGVAIVGNSCIAVSRNNNASEWRELALTPYSRAVYGTGTYRGRSRSITLSQTEMRSWFDRISSATTLPNTPVAGALKTDCVLICTKTQASQFVRKGTTLRELVSMIAKRDMDKESVTILDLSLTKGRKVFKTEVVTTVTLAI